MASAAMLAVKVESQRATIRALGAEADRARKERSTAERQVRDLAHENERLKRENARLRSLTQAGR